MGWQWGSLSAHSRESLGQAGHLQGCHRGPQVAALSSETEYLRPEALLLWDMHEDHARPLSCYLMMIPTHKTDCFKSFFQILSKKRQFPASLQPFVFNSLPFLHLFLNNELPLLSPTILSVNRRVPHTPSCARNLRSIPLALI